MRTKRQSGFTLIEIMIVVAIIGMLAAMAIPNFVYARKNSLTRACINNLRSIDGAKQQWALEMGKTSSDEPGEAEIQPYLGRGDAGTLGKVYCPLVRPTVPMGGYVINQVGQPPDCQQFDAAEHPSILN